MDWPDAVYDRVGNILLSRLMGADVRLVKAGFGIGFKESWEQALAEVEERGGKPYAIPAGALRPPARRPRLRQLGATRSTAQERELGVFFDTVIVCSVTGSTQAGMIAGLRRSRTRRPPPGHRHRRVRQAGRDPRAGRRASRATRPG